MRILVLLLICTNLFSDILHYVENINNKVRKITLDNGLKILVLQRKDAPVFSAVINVLVGGVDEPEGKTGIAHIFEHMAFKGTKTVGTKDFKKEMELLNEYEISKDNPEKLTEIIKKLNQIWEPTEFDNLYKKRGAIDQNATTSKEVTSYFVSLPKTAFEFWAWIESERLTNPVFRQFYSEKEVIKEEKRMRFEDDPNGKIYEQMLKTAFKVHPYKNSVIGTWEDLDSISINDLKDFHKKYYVGNNIVISIVGDISEDEIKLIKKYFSKIPTSDVKRIKLEEPEQKEERKVTVSYSAEPEMIIAYKKPNYPHKDDPAISLLEHILANGSTSVLNKKLLQEEEILASVSVTEEPGSRYPNLFVFSLVPKNPITNQIVLKYFDREIELIKEKGITQEQLDLAIHSITVDYLRRLSGNLSLAEDLAYSETIYGDSKFLYQWLKDIREVTIDDINKIAKKYLDNNQRTIVFLENDK